MRPCAHLHPTLPSYTHICVHRRTQYQRGGVSTRACVTCSRVLASSCDTMLAAERVQEVDVVAGRSLGTLFPRTKVLYPRAVAASASLIAVSSWRRDGREDHSVHVFDARTRAHVQTIGTGCGPSLGQLNRPAGLRITPDGSQVGSAWCCLDPTMCRGKVTVVLEAVLVLTIVCVCAGGGGWAANMLAPNDFMSAPHSYEEHRVCGG
jgi:hypothetical protein